MHALFALSENDSLHTPARWQWFKVKVYKDDAIKALGITLAGEANDGRIIVHSEIVPPESEQSEANAFFSATAITQNVCLDLLGNG